jgi:hypothetical protein
VAVMSLWPRDPRDVPAQTARVVRAVVAGGSFCVRLRDTLGVVFQDEAFTELFAIRAVLPRRRGGWRSSACCSSWRG